jgi:competence protein ComEA
MEPTFRRALSRTATRVAGSRFAKPIARVVVAAAGLVLLAFVGRSAIAGAIGKPVATEAVPVPVATAASAERAEPASPSIAAAPSSSPNSAPSSRAPASADDPVVINTATDADLRRLPGIGPKRADAILALRTRLGRFRAMEDLLKVKGIGRATLKRLRPLIRLDPPAVDAGSPSQPATSSSR